MTTKESEVDVLLPCPFCGEAPAYKVWDNHNYHRAACEACNLEFDFYLSRDELVAAWNRRAAHSDLSGEVRELVRASQAILDGLAVAEPVKRGLFQELRVALAKFTHQEKP